MPRPPRIQFDGATYHVFSRGNRRERIFLCDADYAEFEEMMLDTMQRSKVQLFNWGLMPNHFHFNLQTPTGNLAEYMQRILTRFSKYFNRSHGVVGHVFQGRYGARLIQHEKYFREIIRYVELNPYRLKRGRLAKLGRWKWSSLRHLLAPATQWPTGCEPAFRRVLGAFGVDPEVARKNLAVFLAEGLREGTWEDFYQVRDGRFIGDESFIENAKEGNGESTRVDRRFLKPHDLSQLIDIVRRLSRYSLAQLSESDQQRAKSRWRQALACVSRGYFRIPVVAIARTLRRDPTTVSRLIAAGEHQNSEEKRRLIEAISAASR